MVSIAIVVENADVGFLRHWTSAQWVAVLSNLLIENKVLVLGRNKLEMALVM